MINSVPVRFARLGDLVTLDGRLVDVPVQAVEKLSCTPVRGQTVEHVYLEFTRPWRRLVVHFVQIDNDDVPTMEAYAAYMLYGAIGGGIGPRMLEMQRRGEHLQTFQLGNGREYRLTEQLSGDMGVLTTRGMKYVPNASVLIYSDTQRDSDTIMFSSAGGEAKLLRGMSIDPDLISCRTPLVG